MLRALALSTTLALAAALLPSASAAQMASNAPIKPGDRLVVTLGELTDTIPVRNDGQAVLPRVGALNLNGLSPRAAEDSITRAFAALVRTPDVRVTALRRIAVQGQVPRADVHYVDATFGLAEALALAGGVGPEGNSKKVDLWRDGTQVGRYDARSGAALQVPLESGDIVIVGRASWWSRNPFIIVSLITSAVSLAIALGQ
jgi:protein involved in polysaccharide export with SLBB domain